MTSEFAFNFNIHFRDEPSLNPKQYDPNRKNIDIVKSSEMPDFEDFPVKSPYVPMSGREAAYGADEAFSECKKGCLWGIDIKEIMSLRWVCGEHTVTYMPHKHFTPELLQFWILHTVLPVVLTLEDRYTFLHVGAVEVEGVPIIFSAESFGGKSTITDYFISQGHPLLSDDSLGTYSENGKVMAVASYPFHRPYRETEALGFRVENVMKEAKPIRAVYLLDKADPNADIEISEVKGIEKYKAFHYSAFVNFNFRKEKHFKYMSEIVKQLPVYKVTIPWELERLPEVYNAIIRHKSKIQNA